jgi:DNA-binding NtrC family response regulator
MAVLAHAEGCRADHAPVVLLVDDDGAQRAMYATRLQRRGYEVRCAPSAEAATQAVRASRPDVVVLDIAMPDRDGLSALQEILDNDPSLPVVLHTAYPGYTDNFIAWAAEDYIVKSQNLAPLVGAIDRAVAGTHEAEHG